MIEKFKKYKLIYKTLLFICFLIKSTYNYIFLILFSVHKINNKKVIVINFEGRGYGDNGKYICNELVKYDYRIYWATKEEYKESLPKEINYVKINSIGYLFHLATAKIWINNSRFPYGIRKRKKQFYIQTWHGCFAFKKVESAVEDKLSKYYVLSAKNDSKMADLFISNSTFCTNFYKKYFRYNGDILEYGCPKNDIIISNKDATKNVRKYFGLSNSEKICLYAPTFRANNSFNAYNIEYQTLLDELKNKFKGNWKILIRFHPNISHLANETTIFNKNIINATNYYDMQELLIASNFLITDYSSCIFDYALARKPAIIYASDIEGYRKDRDFEIKLENTPFPIATDNIELKNIIENYDIEEYHKKLDKFYNDMGLNETGQSCKKIVKIINEITKEN